MIGLPNLFLAFFLVFLAKDIVQKEKERLLEKQQQEVRLNESTGIMDPYQEYEAFEALEQENNSIVEVLLKPCDTKVDRSS